jgi:hypothetical protein
MYLDEGEFYHIYNRGNNRRKLFFEDADYLYFLKRLRASIYPFCEILTWCLMPNHFHLMVQANGHTIRERSTFGGKPMQELPYRIGVMLSGYSQHMNRKRNTTGSYFQQKTKAISMSEEMQRKSCPGDRMAYITRQMHYHHQNPVIAGLVQKMEEWPWSSFRDYAGFRHGTLCNKQLLFDITGYKATTFYEESYSHLR